MYKAQFQSGYKIKKKKNERSIRGWAREKERKKLPRESARYVGNEKVGAAVIEKSQHIGGACRPQHIRHQASKPHEVDYYIYICV